MQPDFWLQRWQDDQTGWHRDEVHPHLTRMAPTWLEGGTRVLVPLCGRTLDLAWLAERCEVVGVELSAIAAAGIFADAGMEPTRTAHGPFERWQSGNLSVLVGNFFDLSPAWVPMCDRVWDRAAWIAIHPTDRSRYAEVTRTVAPGARLLFNGIHYDPRIQDGPPWSFSEDQLRAFYPNATLRQRTDVLDERWRERGHSWMESLLFEIELPATEEP